MPDPIPATTAPDPGTISEPLPYYAIGFTVGGEALTADTVPDHPVRKAFDSGFPARKIIGVEGRRSWPVLLGDSRVEMWGGLEWFWENNGRAKVYTRNEYEETNLASNGWEVTLGLKGTYTPLGGWGLTAGPFVYLESGSHDPTAKTGGDPTGGFWDSLAHYGDYSGKGWGFQIGPAYRGMHVDADLVLEWAGGSRDIEYEIVGRNSRDGASRFELGTDRLGARFSLLIHGAAANVVIPAAGIPFVEPPPPTPPPPPPSAPVTILEAAPPPPAALPAPVPPPETAAPVPEGTVTGSESTSGTEAELPPAVPLPIPDKSDEREEKGAPAPVVATPRATPRPAVHPTPAAPAATPAPSPTPVATPPPAVSAPPPPAPPVVTEYKAPATSKPSKTSDLDALKEAIKNKFYWQVMVAMDYGLENLEPSIKNRIVAIYTTADGKFDKEKFLQDFANTAVRKVLGLQWEQKKGRLIDDDGILNPHAESDAEAASFTLKNLKKELEDVGKNIVIGAVFVEAGEESVIRTLTNTSLFTGYGTTGGVGIKAASDCAAGHVTIRFGGGFAGDNAVTVVNENKNLLSARGIQHWRLSSAVPSGCPPIKDIGTNIGLQSIFPYQHNGKDGTIVIYLLMATPGTQVGAGIAMENTLDAIEDIAER